MLLSFAKHPLGRLHALCLMVAMAAPGWGAAEAPGYADGALEDQVQMRLQRDPGTGRYSLQSSVDNGIVTLQGVVSDLLTQQRAVRLAESVPGVAAVVNRLAVEPRHSRSDEDIEADLKAVLATHAVTGRLGIRAEVREGAVTLSGTANSWQERRLAESLAGQVQGVTAVVNDIDNVDRRFVRLPEQIRENVTERLQRDALVGHQSIEVQVRETAVALSGRVASAAEKARAVEDARVPGVREVDVSGLAVDPAARKAGDKRGATLPDEVLREAIDQALKREPRVRSYDVRAGVSQGRVDLQGTVDTVGARRAAEQVVRHLTGVEEVVNRLSVEPREKSSPTAVAQRVRTLLVRHPQVGDQPVNLSVEGGVVYLYGEVDTLLDKAQVEQTAADVPGVTAIKNRLKVRQPDFPLRYNPYVDEYDYSRLDWYDPGARSARDAGRIARLVKRR